MLETLLAKVAPPGSTKTKHYKPFVKLALWVNTKTTNNQATATTAQRDITILETVVPLAQGA